MDATVPALVLVGPPASGKTTLAELCVDIGCFRPNSVDLGDNDETIAWCLEAASVADRRVCVFDGPTTDSFVEQVKAEASDTLVVRVEADQNERYRRHVDRVAERTGDGGLSTAEIQEARDDLLEREQAKRPYPQHHVTIHNDDDTETTELLVRLDELTAVLEPDD